MFRNDMPSLKTELKGADQLSNAMLEFGLMFSGKIIKKAVTKAGRILVGPLRRATPKSKPGGKSRKQLIRNPSGTMRKSTGIAYRTYKGGRLQAAYVGHRWPKGAAAHLVDKGHRVIWKNTTQLGFAKARNFFEPTIAPLLKQSDDVMQAELAKGMEDARRKAAAKAQKVALNSFMDKP